jgi:transcription elongation factor/antiterminator RfaH
LRAAADVTQGAEHARGWYALRTRSRFEFAARDELNRRNIDAWLPTFTEESRWSDRVQLVTRPLFPGYLFARFNLSIANQIRITRGVVEILSIDQKPVLISDDEVATLRRIVESPVPVKSCPYVVGSRVSVARGPFAGVSGVISRIKGSTTLTIPVEILGRSVAVSIDTADVEKRK